MFVRRKNYLEMFDNLNKFAIQQLGIFPVGEIRMLSPGSGNAHNYFRDKIYDANFHTSLATAYAAMVADRNDVLLVLPGLYTELATLDWAKDRCHLIGMGGTNISGRTGRPNTMLYTDTAAVDYMLHITGDFCQFHNIQIQNGTTGGAATGDNLAALGIAGYGNYFKNVSASGINTAAQIAAIACSSVEIMPGSGELLFEKCIIGQNYYGGSRTVENSGHLLYSQNTGAVPSPQNLTFRDTLFLSRGVTADVPMVMIKSAWGTDRLQLFERCNFVNFAANFTPLLTKVFEWDVGDGGLIQTTNILLKQSTAYGYTYWIDAAFPGGQAGTAAYLVMTDGPAAGAGGGLARSAVGTVGT